MRLAHVYSHFFARRKSTLHCVYSRKYSKILRNRRDIRQAHNFTPHLHAAARNNTRLSITIVLAFLRIHRRVIFTWKVFNGHAKPRC